MKNLEAVLIEFDVKDLEDRFEMKGWFSIGDEGVDPFPYEDFYG